MAHIKLTEKIYNMLEIFHRPLPHRMVDPPTTSCGIWTPAKYLINNDKILAAFY